MTTYRPLRDVVLFKFLDDVASTGKGAFTDRPLESGIVLARVVSRQKLHRWGVVFAVGPDAEKDLAVGQYVLIEALMWMEGVKLDDGSKVWKTDPSKVLLVTDDINETYAQ